jgi:hypothetical protein
MTIDEVVSLRGVLKAGKNLPVRVMVNNSFVIIDESNPSQFTKWDDDNGILYSFRLVDMQGDISPSNTQKAISMYICKYEYIEALELPFLPLSNIDDVFTEMEKVGTTMSDEFKTRIKTTYETLLRTDMADLRHRDFNKLTGSNLDTTDEYYNGRFKQPFKETRMMASRNEYVDSLKSKEDSTDSETL